MGLSIPGTEWSLRKRVLFRFAFAYLMLFILFASTPLALLTDGAVLWTGKHLFGVEITFRPAGSRDTTWNYVQLFGIGVVAVAATAVWSVLDRWRANYERLNEWLRVYRALPARRGDDHLRRSQGHPEPVHRPALTSSLQPIGHSSPMGLLWTFMGASPGYTMFTGAAEMLGGLLLVFRRTTLLGALVCDRRHGQRGHAQLLLRRAGQAVLVAPAGHGRLPGRSRTCGGSPTVFLLNRRAEPAEDRPLFTAPRLHRAGLAVRTLLFAALTAFVPLGELAGQQGATGRPAQPVPLAGIWNVEAFTVDGQARPPLLTDETRGGG